MSRYDPLTPRQQTVLDTLRGTTAQTPLAEAAIHTASGGDMPLGELRGDLAYLVTTGYLATLTTTRDGLTTTTWWATGQRPAISQEICMTAKVSKSALLQQMLALHGPATSARLAELAKDRGYNITSGSVGGLLAHALSSGVVVASSSASHARRYCLAETAVAPAAEDVAQASLPASDDTPTADLSTSDDLLARLTEIETQVDRLVTETDQMAAELSTALADQQAAERARDALLADLGDIYRALDVIGTEDAIAEIEHLQKLANARTDRDLGDLGRYRDLLDQIAASLHCDSLDSLPEVVASLGGAPALAQPGRLAILSYVDMAGVVMEYVEPYVSEEEARRLLIRRVESGEVGHGVLVRAIYQAQRRIEYGPVLTPEIATL